MDVKGSLTGSRDRTALPALLLTLRLFPAREWVKRQRLLMPKELGPPLCSVLRSRFCGGGVPSSHRTQQLLPRASMHLLNACTRAGWWAKSESAARSPGSLERVARCDRVDATRRECCGILLTNCQEVFRSHLRARTPRPSRTQACAAPPPCRDALWGVYLNRA